MSNFQSLISNLLFFVSAALVAIVILECNAILGLAVALIGGIVFGILVTREVESG